MQLYLVRHGDALPKNIDPERSLSDVGLATAQRMAEHLATLGLSVDAVWHSTKKRARQTAEVLAPAFGAAGTLIEREGLAPMDAVAPVVKELAGLEEDLAIVGHMPFQSLLASTLLTGDAEGVWLAFSTVAVACLERDDDGVWQLLWMLAPESLP